MPTPDYMPIMLGSNLAARLARGEPLYIVRRVPWALFNEAAERCCRFHHDGQSLADIASRGGLDATEALTILSDRQDWSDFGGEERAQHLLYTMIDMFRRGQHAADRPLPDNLAVPPDPDPLADQHGEVDT